MKWGLLKAYSEVVSISQHCVTGRDAAAKRRILCHQQSARISNTILLLIMIIITIIHTVDIRVTM